MMRWVLKKYGFQLTLKKWRRSLRNLIKLIEWFYKVESAQFAGWTHGLLRIRAERLELVDIVLNHRALTVRTVESLLTARKRREYLISIHGAYLQMRAAHPSLFAASAFDCASLACAMHTLQTNGVNELVLVRYDSSYWMFRIPQFLLRFFLAYRIEIKRLIVNRRQKQCTIDKRKSIINIQLRA